MRYLVSIIIWLYGSVLFFLVIVTITLMACVLPQRVYNPSARFLLRFLVRALGGRVTVEGLDRFDHNATFLFMSNHVSLFDVPILGGYIPNFARGVQAAHQFKWPVFGQFLSRIGNIPIERKSPHASYRSLRKAAQQMKTGKSIIILPEGTRTRDGRLRAFKRLPFQLAKIARADIVPIGTSGLFRFKARTSWLIRPGPIKVKFGEPIYYRDVADLEIEQLRDLVRERIAALIEF